MKINWFYLSSKMPTKSNTSGASSGKEIFIFTSESVLKFMAELNVAKAGSWRIVLNIYICLEIMSKG